MKNFVAVGNLLTFTTLDLTMDAPKSGDGILAGALFGVVTEDAPSGLEDPASQVVIQVTGVFDLPKAPSQAWTVGAKVYWDAANARCTTTATGNTLIGVAVKAVGGTAGETTGRVRLNGSAA